MTSVLVSLLVLACFSSATPDNCYFESSSVHDLTTVTKCLFNVPFSERIRQEALDNLRKTVPLYAFRDIVKDSPPSPLTHIQVDLFAEFDRIENTTYDNDYDFQSDVSSVFIRLKDAHTLYVLCMVQLFI